MSYDYPDGYVPPPRPPLTAVTWFASRWWWFILWCALDAKSERVNRWGLRRLEDLRERVG